MRHMESDRRRWDGRYADAQQPEPRAPEAIDGNSRIQALVPSVGPALDGGYYLIRVDSVEPPALRPLVEIRQQVIADWQAEERQQRAQQAAQDAVEASKASTVRHIIELQVVR